MLQKENRRLTLEHVMQKKISPNKVQMVQKED